MVNPVIFSHAVAVAVLEIGSFNFTIEAGPHPAFKELILVYMKEVSGTASILYTGLLFRGKDDVEAVSGALGFLLIHIGPFSIDLDTYNRLVSSSTGPQVLAINLLSYS